VFHDAPCCGLAGGFHAGPRGVLRVRISKAVPTASYRFVQRIPTATFGCFRRSYATFPAEITV